MQFVFTQILEKQSRKVSLDKFEALSYEPSPTLIRLIEFDSPVVIMAGILCRPQSVDKYLDSIVFQFIDKTNDVIIHL